jgi:hypothetical protein
MPNAPIEWGTVAQYAAAVIALVALARPDITRLLRRWTGAVRLHIHPRLEIGFTHFGPVIGLYGAMECEGHDQTIVSMNIEVVRQDDNSTHLFEWMLIRSPKLHVEIEPKEFEFASAFVLKNSESKNFNIQFHDTKTPQKYEEMAAQYRAGYLGFLSRMEKEGKLSKNPAENFKLFDAAFPNATPALWKVIKDAFYWREGGYTLTVRVNCGNPRKIYEFKYKYNLSREEVRRLEENIVILLEYLHLTGKRQLNYVFAKVDTE